MKKDNKIGNIFGISNTRYLNIVNQVAPYIQSEYVVIEDKLQGDLLAEVIETEILPYAAEKVLPKGSTADFLKKMNYNVYRPIFLAKVKLLNEIPYPVLPETIVRPAKYEEIKHIISKANNNDGMVIGIIKGTELSQDELPEEIKNISPLWEKGSAVSQQGIPLVINHHSFREYPHIGLFGSSGSGKSFALRVLCEELMKLRIPGVAFDPHFELKFEGLMKGVDKVVDSKSIISYSDRYEEFIIGENVGIHFEDLNSGELISLFDFIDPLTEPQKNALELLFEKGDSFEHFKKKVVAIKEAFEIKERMVRGKKLPEDEFTPLQADLYGRMKSQISGSLTLQALSWKCTALEKTNIFVGDISDVKRAMKKRKLAIIRGDIRRLQMISSYLITKLYKERRNYVDKDMAYFPPFFIIVDEAHNFAPEGRDTTPTKSILRKIGQEARKYGVFEIMSTQRPKNLDNTLLAQLNTKFIFRLTDSNDMQVAKVEGNLTDGEVSRLPDLASGNCFVSSATLNKTYPVRFRTTFSKAPNSSDPFKEMDEKIKEVDGGLQKILLDFLPITTLLLGRNLPKICDSYGKNVSLKEVIEMLEDMVKEGVLKKEKDPIGIKYVIS